MERLPAIVHAVDVVIAQIITDRAAEVGPPQGGGRLVDAIAVEIQFHADQRGSQRRDANARVGGPGQK